MSHSFKTVTHPLGKLYLHCFFAMILRPWSDVDAEGALCCVVCRVVCCSGCMLLLMMFIFILLLVVVVAVGMSREFSRFLIDGS